MGSIELLLYNKEIVLNLLIEHLHVDQSLAYEPLLCLLAALAHDLGPEFYPHFEAAFIALIPLLRDNHDPETVEVRY